MIEISRYMDDGAGWQEQAVLAYVRSQYETIKDIEKPEFTNDKEKEDYRAFMEYAVNVKVGRYENGREQGYVFSANIVGVGGINVAVYEHRNTDSICLIIFGGSYFDTPSVETIWKGREDKWDFDACFKYGDILDCGKKVVKVLYDFLQEKVPVVFKVNFQKKSQKC